LGCHEKCIKLTGSKLISEDKFYHKYKLSRSTKLNGFNYGLSNNECQTEQTDQKGGTYSDPYYNENFADEVCSISFNNSLQKSSQTIKSYTYYAGLYEQFDKLMNIIKVN
jgi:hypothetical protein